MKKVLSIILSISLVVLINAPVVLAKNTSEKTTGTTSSTVTTTATSTKTAIPNGTSTATTTPVVNSQGNAVSPGTLPDSPFYWFSGLIQQLQLALTFDPGKKADLAEHQALEKLAGAQEMIKHDKKDQAEKALSDYADKIAQAQEYLAKIQDPNSDAAKALAAALSQSNVKNLQVLAALIDKLPPQAAQRIALNIVRHMEKDVAKYQKQLAKKDKKDSSDDLDSALAALQTKADPGKKAVTTSSTVNIGQPGKGEENRSDVAKQNEKGQKGALEQDEHASTQPAQGNLDVTTSQQAGVDKSQSPTQNHDGCHSKTDSTQTNKGK